MFVSFAIQNVYSFDDEQMLSARAVKTCKERLLEATFQPLAGREERLVKTLAIYGANASGKTNVFLALADMRDMVLSSAAQSQSGVQVRGMPFLFAEENLKQPSVYTLEFILGEVQYKYGYAATEREIVGEYLVRKEAKGRRYRELFSRALIEGEQKIHCLADFGADELVISKTRANALFLSTCAMLAVPEAERIIDYFANKLKVISADRMTPQYTSRLFATGRYTQEVTRFLKMTDAGIGELSVNALQQESGRIRTDGSKEMVTAYEAQVKPLLKSGTIAAKSLPLQMIASQGTMKAFNLAAHIFEALETGAVLVLDELDSRLHPLLTKEIIRLFNSAETNPKNAQLIFNTHDTNLLSVRVYETTTDKKVYLLRRDEIYFVEKNGEMCSKIYSLIDFKKNGHSVRNDATYEKDYLAGLYGAIPYIGKW